VFCHCYSVVVGCSVFGVPMWKSCWWGCCVCGLTLVGNKVAHQARNETHVQNTALLLPHGPVASLTAVATTKSESGLWQGPINALSLGWIRAEVIVKGALVAVHHCFYLSAVFATSDSTVQGSARRAHQSPRNFRFK
jgi:hypothetical protein